MNPGEIVFFQDLGGTLLTTFLAKKTIYAVSHLYEECWEILLGYTKICVSKDTLFLMIEQYPKLSYEDGGPLNVARSTEDPFKVVFNTKFGFLAIRSSDLQTKHSDQLNV